MKGIYAVFRKEMSQYFVSPIGYVATGTFLFLAGVFFQLYLGEASEYAMRAAMQAMQYGQPFEMDVTGETMRGFFGVAGTLLLFIMPMLTMGSYAEERRRGTMELLMTSPLTDLEIVLGKFLGAFALFLIMLLPTVLQMVILFKASDPVPPWRLMFCGYLGLMLLGAAFLALGQFVSSLTENQVVAGVWTFVASLLLWIMNGVVRGGSGGNFMAVAQYLSILKHLDDFFRGVIDSTNLIYYGSLILLGIVLTLRSIDSMRWRRA